MATPVGVVRLSTSFSLCLIILQQLTSQWDERAQLVIAQP